MTAGVAIARGVSCGDGSPLLIAGPCVLEHRELAIEIGGRTRELCARHGFQYVFKASIDKANRSSAKSFRGVGLEQGAEILAAVRAALDVPVLTDVHETAEVAIVAPAVDVLQIPAFLCRQTDLVMAAAASGRVVNIKKGQFLPPAQMRFLVEKARAAKGVLVTERGATFGYGDLVVDMRSLVVMRAFAPVIYDATHSVQRMGGETTGGDRGFILPLARAAAAVGIDGLFAEVYPNPAEAKSDASTSLSFAELDVLLAETSRLWERREKAYNPTP